MTVFSNISTLKKDAFKNTANGFVPNSVVVPIKQDCENNCEWLVKAGDIVDEGQVIASSSNDGIKSYIYSPIPGKVCGIEICVCPNGRTCEGIRINLAGRFSFLGKKLKELNVISYSQRMILSLIEEKGIVNTFTANEPNLLASDISKLSKKSKLLIVRLFDEDPSRLTDSLITRMFFDDVIKGAKIVAKSFDAQGIVLVGEKGFVYEEKKDSPDNENSNVDKTKKSNDEIPIFFIRLNSKKYPSGYKNEIVHSVKKSSHSYGLFKEISKKDLFTDSSTMLEVYRTVSFNMPVIDRYVYISGDCVPSTGLLKVAIGTSIKSLVEQSGGLIKNPVSIIINGIVCGVSSGTLDAPVTKYVKSVTFLSKGKSPDQRQLECVRCGNCRRACPLHLSPDIIYNRKVFLYAENTGDVYIKSAQICNGCGLCNAVCPARLPLSQVIYNITENTKIEDDDKNESTEIE